jgi:hypothetical protein
MRNVSRSRFIWRARVLPYGAVILASSILALVIRDRSLPLRELVLLSVITAVGESVVIVPLLYWLARREWERSHGDARLP